MAANRFVDRKALSAAEAHLARVADEGSARHRHLACLIDASGPHANRDVADAVHLLCSIHGHHPGLVELALELSPSGPASEWLGRAAAAFERERLYLVRLTAAVGPLPSTPGAAETEATDTVWVNYAGYLKDGKLFDSGTNVKFIPAQLVPGFRTGMVGMKVGGRRKIVIPSELGYGGVSRRDPVTGKITIPRQSTLIFDIDLLNLHTP